MKVLYQCEYCNSRYDTAEEAQRCEQEAERETIDFQVGDIVTCSKGMGWLDTDNLAWVATDVPGRSYSGRVYTLYYVVAQVKRFRDEHEYRYWVITNALSGNQGHRAGWTGKHHYRLTKVENPPEQVVLESKLILSSEIKDNPRSRLL